MAEKKKRKGLMAVLSEYQTEKGYGPKTKGKGPVKSGKEYGKTLKQNKKEDASGPKVLAPKKKDPPKPKPKTNSGSGAKSNNSAPKKTTPTPPKSDRVSKFLGGQTIKQVQDAAKKREEKKKNTPKARQQAELDRLRAAQAKERKKRQTKGRSSWAKGQLKGL